MISYNSYKSSGIIWAGEIPSNWNISKIKFVANNEDGKREPISGEFRHDKKGDYPYYGATGIVDYINEFRFDGKYLLIGEDGAPFFIPNKNVAFIAEGKFWVNNHAHVLSCKDEIDLDYLCHLLNCVDYRAYISGSTRDKLTKADLSDIRVLLPSFSEQNKIAQYLDHQTSIIDQLIQQKEKLIELLKEKRQAVINEAVTKGLNPNAKMKDSGIEWLGQVPGHWRVLKFRYLIDVLTDFTANGSFADLAKNVTYLDEGFSRLIRLTDLRENLENDGIYVSEESHNYLSKSALYGNEILLANVGAYAGLAWKVPNLTEPSTLGPNMFLLKFDLELNNDFAYFTLISDYLSSQLKTKAISSAQPKLNKEDVRSCLFVLPPIKEQIEITEYLLEENQKFDNVLTQETLVINKLKEYRQSKISEAVTGKIDVREWQPKKNQVA